MKKYTHYSSIDFTHDDHFLKWVKYPGQSRQRERFWQEWTKRHPEKDKEVQEAKRMILAVIEEQQFIPSEHKQHEIWNRLQQSINEDSQPRLHVSFWRRRLAIAATISLLITSVAAIVWFNRDKHLSPQTPTLAEANLVKEYNNSNQPRTIILSDGSSIILKPQSSLEFPKVFQSTTREVRLSGEAFFEVAKDPKRPFVTHADKLVTKVLGTSFNIRAFDNEKNVSVQVKTGKVSVYLTSELTNSASKANQQLEGVLLTPNQQVVFSRGEERLVKSLVDNPSLLGTSRQESFEFHDKPLREVFSTLERAYGVRIVYDEDVMGNCALNASLDDMPLYDKLRLICKGVDARYEILDSHIVITGKGCN